MRGVIQQHKNGMQTMVEGVDWVGMPSALRFEQYFNLQFSPHIFSTKEFWNFSQMYTELDNENVVTTSCIITKEVLYY